MGPWWPAPSAALRAAAQHWATWAMQKQELARNLISQHDLLLRNQVIGRYLRGAKSEVTKAEKYPSAALRAAAQHWATWAMQKQELARNLISQHDLLLRNQGRTAEDLIGRYLRGAKSEVTKAEKYEIKKGAFNTAADAIDYLRSRLTGIAGEGNKEIDDVLASKKPLPEQLAEIQAIQTRCNADAANASRDAVDKVMTAMQEILEAEDIGDDPRTWARANGFNVDDAPPPRLIRENDLAALTGPGARGGSFGSVEGAGDLASPQSVGAGGFSGSGVQAACSQPAPRAIGASSRHASAGPVPPAPVVTTPAAATPPVIATGPRWRCPAGRCRRRPSDRAYRLRRLGNRLRPGW
ncbi:alanine rich protein [Mycobacterium tuberculosis M984]|nr:alanine rich protein [Mycobacterium tuberculosis M984]